MASRKARTVGTAIAATALSAGALAVAAAPANASPRTPVPYYNCTYPYVCLYNQTVDIVGRYKDVTTGYQSFSRTDVYYGLNTRNDDIAFIRYTDGSTACLPAGDPMAIYDLREFGTPNGIKISSAAVCPVGMAKISGAKKAS